MKKNKSKNIILIISISLFIVAIVIFILSILWNNNELDSSNPFYEEREVDKVAKLDVQLMLDYFASNESTSDIKAHIVFDKNSVPYIVLLNAKSEKKLKPILDYTYSANEGNMIEPITIYGKTGYINNKLKELAIKYYNDFLNNDMVNTDNFYNYFGVFYLDTTQNLNKILIFGSILSSVSLIGGSICLFIYFKSKNSKKKTLPKMM